MAADDFLPDSEIDPITGKLRQAQQSGGAFVQSSLNRNLLYTKPEVDAIVGTKITVSTSAPSSPKVNDLWLDIS